MTASNTLLGIHHVTAVTADAQRNIDFYTGVLGLRLVKLTVNFDDPGSYHLYYGDGAGTPGTVMTFFAWPDTPRGRIGPPQASATAFAVPTNAIEYWARRLTESGIDIVRGDRFNDAVVAFDDPDGLRLELVGVAEPLHRGWIGGSVPNEFAVRSFHGVTLSEPDAGATAALLVDQLGFQPAGSESNRFRYQSPAGIAPLVDVLHEPGRSHGSPGVGVVHHVAFAAANGAEQGHFRDALRSEGYNVTPVRDRHYFRSVYFREPGGVLFELATVDPGFEVDEPREQLGSGLRLPPWLEPRREEIVQGLPPVHLP